MLCSIWHRSDQVQSGDGIDAHHEHAERSLRWVQSFKAIEHLLHLWLPSDDRVCVGINGFGFLLVGVFRVASLALHQNELDARRELKRLIEILTLWQAVEWGNSLNNKRFDSLQRRVTWIYHLQLRSSRLSWSPGSNIPSGSGRRTNTWIWDPDGTPLWRCRRRSSSRSKSAVASLSTAQTPPSKTISWHQLRVVLVKAFCIVVTTLNNLAVLIWLNYWMLYCCLFLCHFMKIMFLCTQYYSLQAVETFKQCHLIHIVRHFFWMVQRVLIHEWEEKITNIAKREKFLSIANFD